MEKISYPWDIFWREYWKRAPFPPSEDLPDPGIEPMSLASPALAGGFFITVAPGNTLDFATTNLGAIQD